VPWHYTTVVDFVDHWQTLLAGLIASIILLAALPSSASPATQDSTCMVAALNDYNKANLALLTKSELLMTVETTIAQRRLQEQYCLRVAQCQLASLPLQNTTMALDAAFSTCLRDEAMEKYELVPTAGH
jgi:hypothetical protein